LAIDPLIPTLNEMGVRLLNYLLPAGDGYETFHAKVVVADADQAYVGSANMTKYARHSMELGVVLRGRSARAVAALVRAVEHISLPIRMR
jgi:phosphatidylserine/phosphatidylglycerophosphate/cardiolipin synthase-like enzyme